VCGGDPGKGVYLRAFFKVGVLYGRDEGEGGEEEEEEEEEGELRSEKRPAHSLVNQRPGCKGKHTGVRDAGVLPQRIS
jgi:hypothetical protein